MATLDLPSESSSRLPAVAWAIAFFADALLFRGHGYAGFGVFLLTAAFLCWLGISQRSTHNQSRHWHTFAVLTLLSLCAARLVWLGSVDVALLGLMLLPAFAFCLFGYEPFVVETIVYGICSTALRGLSESKSVSSGRRSRQPIASADNTLSNDDVASTSTRTAGKMPGIEFFLPVSVIAIFATIFTLANPDMIQFVTSRIKLTFDWAWDVFSFISIWEIPFFVFVLILAAGLLRPRWFPTPTTKLSVINKTDGSPYYAAFRNTLLAVVALFAAYLVFEFYTLWVRPIPANFYYAGYAHEGAAWLTIALGLATVLLSVIFRGEILGDPRLAKLKRWAWMWSGLNLLLALAVYNRMGIYIRHNGMTRMRVVGLFGISAVVVGFILVIIRIRRHYNFTWLLQRQLWTLFCAIALYCVLPVDSVVHRYNTWQVLSGYLPPSVQITEHPVNNEGCRMLIPLLNCEDPIIRNGIASMLADRLDDLSPDKGGPDGHWTGRQLSNEKLHQELSLIRKNEPGTFASVQNSLDRKAAWDQFREYAFQWY